MKKIALSMIVAATGLAHVAAHAAGPVSNGGVLTINGQLTSNTCDVSGNGGGNNFTVTLPSLSSTEFSAAGSTAGATGFNIALSNCTPNTGNVHTFWEYGANTLADGSLKNNGTATNVSVQLLDYNGSEKVLDLSKPDAAQNSQNVPILNGKASLLYAARYFSAGGGATAGTVTTNVTYSIVYQ